MCYLPLGCLKFVVGLGAVVSIVISLGLLGLTIYANIEKKGIINNTGGPLVNDALVGLYLGSAVFMILGICGVYGAMKSRKKQKNSGNCFLFFYMLGVLVFFAVFLAGTIFFFVGPLTIFGTDCKAGSRTQLIKQLNALQEKANTTFCTSKCPCFINQTNQGSYLAEWLKVNITDYKNTTNVTAKNYQYCQPQDQAATNLLLLGALQQLLGCGGWCPDDKLKYSKFFDINSCVTKDCLFSVDRLGCHKAFQDFLQNKGQMLGFGCSTATLICLINVITVCCICNHPSKKSRSSNFYAKMMDQD